MDIVYQRERATATEVQVALPGSPSNSTVRTLLAILVAKGALKTEKDGLRYVYHPTKPRRQAGKSAMRSVLETFFAGSVENAVAALLDSRSGSLTHEEYERLQKLIQQAKSEDKSS